MQPLVKQHLESLRKTLTEVVMPELTGNPFAAEQAGLIAASLALLAEVQPYEDDYLRLELADLRGALAALEVVVAADEPPERDALVERVHALKEQLGEALCARTDAQGRLPQALRARLSPYIDRQLAREAAWSRLTGFNPASAALAPIREVLAQQRRAAV